jgi:multidrug transporter EmrE-like cation transporter
MDLQGGEMLYLWITILADVTGVALLGKARGLTHPWLFVAGLMCMIAGFAAFSFATKTVSVAVANTLWSGASIALVLVIGRVFMGEAMSIVQYVFLGLVLVGVVGLQIAEKS